MQIITKQYEVYTFEELSDSAQDKVISNNYDINVDYDWYSYLYDDAEAIGLKITEFDTARHIIKGRLTDHIDGVIPNILKNHGEQTTTYQCALEFKAKLDKIEESYNNNNNDDEFTDARVELETEFCLHLLECYLSLLRKEYYYQTSKEAIKNTLIANECLFLIDGKPFN